MKRSFKGLKLNKVLTKEKKSKLCAALMTIDRVRLSQTFFGLVKMTKKLKYLKEQEQLFTTEK